MLIEIYKSTSPKRTTLRAVFEKGTPWGVERSGHIQQNWEFIREFDTQKGNLPLPFSISDAESEINTNGVFLYQVTAPDFEQARHVMLNNYRLNFTLPLFSEPPNSLSLLGTGTLFEHEERYFMVTADHIFREDEDDPNSALIDMTTVGVPVAPRPANQGSVPIISLGKHNVYRITPPVLIDVIVVELLEPETITALKAGWSFLPFTQAEDIAISDDRFVITGFMGEGLKYDSTTNVVGQAMLNLETDYLHYTPKVKDPVPQFDLFFYLQSDMTNVDGTQRTVKTLRGLSGGPIWAVRDVAKGEVWAPAKAMKIVAVQSSEFQGQDKWSRGFRWQAVQQILRQSEVGLNSPP
ncbi:hypothetical protein [Methylobacterium indicum]|uniref:hypothetical protein n=1 Tax=Methylobacterium indicum TaxID=1775910 RepID=UPI000AB56DBA|nr:hypothetical protein [Methylobacterium indicum]